MKGSGQGATDAERIWRAAFAEYSLEITRTFELLSFAGRPTPQQRAELELQRTAEQKAFERYHKASRAYLDLLRSMGSLAVLVTAQPAFWVAVALVFRYIDCYS